MRCCAKLNLYLRIVGRRPDGYHELETVFQQIDLCDELEARVTGGRVGLRCDAPDLPTDHSNLVVKAASLLRAQPSASVTTGALLTLRKAIPVGAGLGGGSSDAAGALRLLNELWGLGLDEVRLHHLAGQLGADVPFFLKGGAAVGRGRGEKLERLPPAPTRWFVLAKPAAGVETAWAYSLYRPGAEGVSVDDFLTRWADPRPASLAECLRNDLEAGVIAARPDIGALLLRLREAGCVGARMTGSGAAVFGLCEGAAHAANIATALRDEPGVWATAAQSVG